MEYTLIKKVWTSVTFIWLIIILGCITKTYSLESTNLNHPAKYDSNVQQVPYLNTKPHLVINQNINQVTDTNSYALNRQHHRLKKRNVDISQGFRSFGKVPAYAALGFLYLVSSSLQVLIEVAAYLILSATGYILVPFLACVGAMTTMIVALAGWSNQILPRRGMPGWLSRRLQTVATKGAGIRSKVVFSILFCIPIVFTAVLSLALLPFVFLSVLFSLEFLLYDFGFSKVHQFIQRWYSNLRGDPARPIIRDPTFRKVQHQWSRLSDYLDPLDDYFSEGYGISITDYADDNTWIQDYAARNIERAGGPDRWLANYEEAHGIGSVDPQAIIEEAQRWNQAGSGMTIEAAEAAAASRAEEDDAIRRKLIESSKKEFEIIRFDKWVIMPDGDMSKVAIEQRFPESRVAESSASTSNNPPHYGTIMNS